jgi:hypothetical protein
MMLQQAPSMTLDQEDGARWFVYDQEQDPRGYTIITSEGHSLLQCQDQEGYLRSLIHRYRAAELGTMALLGEDPDIRQELGRGQQAIVYRMGRFAVREEVGIKDFHVALGELQRMDAINNFMEHGLPRWLNLPAHYALHVDPSRQMTYGLMERIDSGLTVEDVVNFPDIPANRAKVLIKETTGDVADAQACVPELYERAHEALVQAIESDGKNPDQYLTDWKPRNVLVDRLRTPVAGSRYSLSVIDQYRA